MFHILIEKVVEILNIQGMLSQSLNGRIVQSKKKSMEIEPRGVYINSNVKKSDKEHSDLATKQLGKKPDYRASRKWKLGVLHIFFWGGREKGRNIRNKIKAKKEWGQKSICFLNQ